MQLVPELTASREDIVVDDVQFRSRLLGSGQWWVRWRSIKNPSLTSDMRLEAGAVAGSAKHFGESFTFIVNWRNNEHAERRAAPGYSMMTPAAVLELAALRGPRTAK